MGEQSEIQFGLTRIPFQIRRSMRRGTVALTIEHDGGLVVTAPNEVSVDKLNAVVRDKAFWVIQHSRKVRELAPRPAEREFVSGETVLYLGRQLRLKVVDAGENVGRRIWAGWYEIPVDRALEGEERRREVRRRLIASLREHAELYLPDRLADVCARARVDKPSLIVCAQRKRWGSCDAAGTLRINWRIIQAPIPLIEYVLAHELVHLVHLRHGPDFWATLGRRMPDYEERRKRLRVLGPALEW
jgi:predicted metal-dependent hydrolase